MTKRSTATKHFKPKAIKTYASTEWLADSKKKYRQVFDRMETGYVYAEFSFYNKRFDDAPWHTTITLKVFAAGKGRRKEELGSIEVERDVMPDQPVIYIREGWGNEVKGSYWKEGEYVWEVLVDGDKVADTRFYIQDVGVVSTQENPYFSIEKILLYEGSNVGLPAAERIYYTEFPDKESRFIWAEVSATHTIGKNWMCEMTFNFYNDARQLKGTTTELLSVRKEEKSFSITSGWGSDHPGTWFIDNYTLEIVFMDTLLAVVPFTVGNDFIEGTPEVLRPSAAIVPAIAGAGIAPPDLELDQLTLDEVLRDMDALIGLESVKQRVREYATYLQFLQLRQERGFEDKQALNLHVVFTGNPGTGKTTVAKMLGRIYRKLGLLTKGHVHEVDRADLVGEYIGQTAPKVRAAIDRARGGILFIDEAYALARTGEEDSKDFGREVIELLVKEMSNGKGDIAIVVAGYPKEMETFINSNPGLKSRFTLRFDFPDYMPDELSRIADYAADKRVITLLPESKSILDEKLVEAYRSRDKSFGNARYVFSLIDEAKMNLGLRVMRTHPDASNISREDLANVLPEDILTIFDSKGKRRPQLPVDEALLKQALDELNKLVGLHSVKNEVNELVKLVRFYKETGRDVLNRFSLHTVFTGNPGTGKTTVARIVGKIYKALGILERGDVVECDRQALVGGFVGQTAIKTADVIEKARGSVLFIDEAYTLTQGGTNDYGREALESLLKRMEDMRGEIIVIVAGYTDNMKQFLEANPGLKSRFDRKIHFDDYSVEDLQLIAQHMLMKEGSVPEEAAAAHLAGFFTHLYKNKDKYFGNARAVRKVVEKALKNQHLRLASLDREARTPEALRLLTVEDVREFTADNDSLLEGDRRRIGF